MWGYPQNVSRDWPRKWFRFRGAGPFYKTEECKAAPGEMVDYYRAKGLKGENVYIHFYIDIATDTLIIQSCKKLEE